MLYEVEMITKKINKLYVTEFPPSRRTHQIQICPTFNEYGEPSVEILQLFLSFPFVQIFYSLHKVENHVRILTSDDVVPKLGISFTEESVFENKNQQVIHIPLPNIILSSNNFYLLYTNMETDKENPEQIAEMIRWQFFETTWSFENRNWPLVRSNNTEIKEIYKKWEMKSNEERMCRLPPYSKVDFPKLNINFLELIKNAS